MINPTGALTARAEQLALFAGHGTTVRRFFEAVAVLEVEVCAGDRAATIAALCAVARTTPSVALTPASLGRFSEIWNRFERFSRATGITTVDHVTPLLASRFVHAKTATHTLPSTPTMHQRRTAVRLLFRIARHLEVAVSDPTLERDPTLGGRPMKYPKWFMVAMDAILTIYRSSRRAETELGHPPTWRAIQHHVRERFPDNPSMWLCDEPPRRHHWYYFRQTYLCDEEVWADVSAAFRATAAATAVETGLCTETGQGSLTHPHASRAVYGDGKVITPLYKAKRGTKKVNKETGEVRTPRSDPDAELHITGSGEASYGNKFVIIACRGETPHSRVILDIRQVTSPGGEMAEAVAGLDDVLPLLPGALTVIYDGAARGKHRQHVMTRHGIDVISPPVALSGGKRVRKPRVERTVFVETAKVKDVDGTVHVLQLYARGGHLGYTEVDDAGEPLFIPLKRRQRRRRKNADETWRQYCEYQVPPDLGTGTVLIRLDTTDEDRRRRFNRAEHLRAMAPGDEDYDELYPTRPDAESINRALEDSLWINRAHSKGGKRQRAELLGFGLVVNSLTEYRAKHPPGTAQPHAA